MTITILMIIYITNRYNKKKRKYKMKKKNIKCPEEKKCIRRLATRAHHEQRHTSNAIYRHFRTNKSKNNG